MTWVIGGLLVCWAIIVLVFVFKDIGKGMAMYPTPRSEYVDVVQRFEKYRSMESWFETMYPEAFKEWCAVYDIERSVKDGV